MHVGRLVAPTKIRPAGGFGKATQRTSEYTEQPQQEDDWNWNAYEPEQNAFHLDLPLSINISGIHLIRDS